MMVKIQNHLHQVNLLLKQPINVLYSSTTSNVPNETTQDGTEEVNRQTEKSEPPSASNLPKSTISYRILPCRLPNNQLFYHQK